MNVIILASIAACSAAISNLCYRKCADSNASVYRFLFYFYLTCFLWSFIFKAESIFHSWNPTALAVGCGVGLLNVCVLLFTGQALQRGPAGLTFTFQNASAVFSNPLLLAIFGTSFGFIVTGYQVVGMTLVLIGLLTGAFLNKDERKLICKGWIKYAFAIFLFQIVIYSILEARCLLNICSDGADAWLMTGFFGTALLVQSVLFCQCKGPGSLREVVYGIIGGLLNGTTTYLLLAATAMALPIEAGLVFPVLSILILILCNLWGWLLYQEHLNYAAIILCSAGILVAAINS